MWERRFKLIILTLFCVFMVSCCPGHKNKKINSGLFKYSKAKNATVYIGITNLTTEGPTAGSGTGVAIDRSLDRDRTLIMTAGHLCMETFGPNILFSEIRVMTREGKGYYGTLVAIDPNFDLCLIRVDEQLPIAKIAKKIPKSGDKVSYSGYPTGFYIPGTLNYFDGYMSGTDMTGDHLYNLPATGGSSGSPIYNEKGAVVAIVSAVMVDFEHMVFAVGTDNIKNFILDNPDWSQE